ncbi:MAG: PA-phosphatase, partial [Actinomycetota bacterium]|nr:PA-phosphatase [Actinomycetota bacterium]
MIVHRLRRVGVLLAAAATLLALAAPPLARADAVTDWNRHAASALITSAGQAPPVALLHLAMVHGAVYDAVNSIDRSYRPYLTWAPATPFDSKEAAAATAAYRVLVSI